MGIYDRDYYRAAPPRGGFGYFYLWSVTTWLIIINVSVFFLDGMLHRMTNPDDAMGPLEHWGYFSAVHAVQVWRFITFQFLHASPGHLFANMIGLYFFGPIVEAHFGPRRYLAFYLLCGLAGAASYLVLAATHVLGTLPQTRLVGASAGIFGLLVSAAIIAPDVTIYIFVPIPIKVLAIFAMVLAAYTVFALGPAGENAGGEAAHLGGGVLGFLLMKNQHWLHVFAPRAAPPFAAPLTTFDKFRAGVRDGLHRRTGARISTAKDRPSISVMITGTLQDWLLADPDCRPPVPKHEIIGDVIRAMAGAHQQAIYHGNLSPASILLTKVTAGGPANRLPRPPDAGTKITGFGTAGAEDTSSGYLYLSPEALSAAPDPARADVFAIGVIWYQLLVGRLERPPYDFADVLRGAGEVSHTIAMIARCLASPGRRFANAHDLEQEFAGEAPPLWPPVPKGCVDVSQIVREYLAAPSG